MRTLLGLIVVFLIASTGVADAKGLLGARVCGAAGCVDHGRVAGGAAALEGGPPTAPPTATAPFYRIRYRVGEHGRVAGSVTNLYVPSARLVRSDDGTWMEPPPATIAALDRLVRGTPPFSASKLRLPARSSTAQPAADDGDGPPALVWAAAAAIVLAALAAAGWHRHRPAAAG